MDDIIKQAITDSIPREFLLDFYEKTYTTFQKVDNTIRDEYQLKGSDASWASGLLRFINIQADFKLDAPKYEGIDVSKQYVETLPKMDRIYQPFHLFENKKSGPNVLLGFTSLLKSKQIPKYNLSRQTAIKLNKPIAPNPDLFDSSVPIDTTLANETIYVCLCVVRDNRSPASPAEIALGIIDPSYQTYIYYFLLKEILMIYSDKDANPAQNEKPNLTLKKNALLFGATSKKKERKIEN